MKNPKASANRSWIDQVKRNKAGVVAEPTELVLAEDVDDGSELLPEAQAYWEAFVFLNLQRRTGDKGPEALTLSDIHAYFQIVAFEPWEMQFALGLLTDLDQLWLATQYKNIQAQQERDRKRQEERSRRG